MGFLKRIFNKNETKPKEQTPKTKPKLVKSVHKEPKEQTPKTKPKTRVVDETETKGSVGIKLGMYIPPKIEKDPEDLTELDNIKNRERELYYKMSYEEGYFRSEISKEEFRELNKWKNDYLERNPKDFLTRGANIYPVLWIYVERAPNERLEMYKLMGEGFYYEKDLEDYTKAIEFYKKANQLTWEYDGDILREHIEEWGEGDYLDTAKQMERIRVCEHKIERAKIKKLEAEAKELEGISPTEAIKKYEELNEVNPGLKKYNKRIYRMRELEAKELEKTDTIEAIRIYSELNILNPGLKKYDKRIEIIKRNLD